MAPRRTGRPAVKRIDATESVGMAVLLSVPKSAHDAESGPTWSARPCPLVPSIRVMRTVFVSAFRLIVLSAVVSVGTTMREEVVSDNATINSTAPATCFGSPLILRYHSGQDGENSPLPACRDHAPVLGNIVSFLEQPPVPVVYRMVCVFFRYSALLAR